MSRTAEELTTELSLALKDRVADPDILAARILDAFAQITPEAIEVESSSHIEYIDILKPDRSGVTIKPGNIRLNWRKLFEKTPELVLTGAGVTQVWLIPFAALYVWNLVWALAQIDISPDHGSTMYALWSTGSGVTKFTEAEALAVVNKFRSENSMQELMPSAFGAIVDELVRLKCIELTDGNVWLREWVKKKN